MEAPNTKNLPAWNRYELTEADYTKTLEDLSDEKKGSRFVVTDRSIAVAGWLTWIWQKIRGIFRYEDRTDVVKVQYELLKLLQYGENRHYLEKDAVQGIVKRLSKKLKRDQKQRFGSAVRVLDAVVLSEGRAQLLNRSIIKYYSDHPQLQGPVKAGLFARAVQPLQRDLAFVAYNQGWVFYTEGRYGEAVVILEKAIEKVGAGNEQGAWSHLLIKAYVAEGARLASAEQHAQALDVYRKATAEFAKRAMQDAIDPLMLEVYRPKAILEQRLGLYGDAIASLEKVGDSPSVDLLLRAAFTEKDLQASVVQLDALWERSSLDAEARSRVVAWLLDGNRLEAAEHAVRASRHKIDWCGLLAAGYELVASRQEQLRQQDQALALLEKALLLRQTQITARPQENDLKTQAAHVCRRRASVLEAQNKYVAAREALEQAKVWDASIVVPVPLVMKGVMALLDAKALDQIVSVVDDLLARPDFTITERHELEKELVKRSLLLDVEAVVTLKSKRVQWNHILSNAYTLLAESFLSQQKPREAVQAYGKAMMLYEKLWEGQAVTAEEINRHRALFLQQMARLQRGLGHYEEAIVSILKCQAIDPSVPMPSGLILEAAHAALSSKQFDKAVTYFDQLWNSPELSENEVRKLSRTIAEMESPNILEQAIAGSAHKERWRQLVAQAYTDLALRQPNERLCDKALAAQQIRLQHAERTDVNVIQQQMVQLYRKKASLYEGNNDWIAAIDSRQKARALSRDPQDEPSTILLLQAATLSSVRGAPEKAVTFIDQLWNRRDFDERVRQEFLEKIIPHHIALERACAASTHPSKWRVFLAQAYHLAGDQQAREQHHQKALESYNHAVGLLEIVISTAGADEREKLDHPLGYLMRSKASSLQALGRFEESLASTRQGQRLLGQRAQTNLPISLFTGAALSAFMSGEQQKGMNHLQEVKTRVEFNAQARQQFVDNLVERGLQDMAEMLCDHYSLTSKAVDLRLARAHKALTDNHTDQAIELLEDCRERDPRRADVFHMLAQALLKKERFDQAVAAIENAIRLVPTDSSYAALGYQVHSLAAEEHVSRGDWDLAATNYRRMLSFVQDNPALHAQFPKHEELPEDLSEALSHLDTIVSLEEAITLSPEKADLHLRLGQLYLTQGRLKDSRQRLENALRLRPSDSHIAHVLAGVCAQDGNFDRAIELYRKAGELKGNPSLYNDQIRITSLTAAEAQLRQSDPVSALKRYQEALSLSPDRLLELAPGLIACADALMESDRESAIRTLRVVLPVLPRLTLDRSKAASIYGHVGRAEASSGHFSEAITLLTDALKINANQPDIRWILGDCYKARALQNGNDMHDLRKAGEVYESAADDDKQKLVSKLSEIANLRNELEWRREWLRKCMAVDSRFVDSYLTCLEQLAEKAEATTDYSKALPYWEEIVQVNPSNRQQRNRLGLTYYQLGNIDKAIEHLDEENRRRVSHDHYNKGYQSETAKNFDAAYKHYAIATTLSPSIGEYWNGKASACEALGKLEEAVEAYHKALAIVGSDWNLWYRLGSVEARRGRLDAATEALEKAMRFPEGSNNPDLSRTLAQVYLDTKRYDAAYKIYKALRDQDGMYNALVGAGDVAYNRLLGAPETVRKAIIEFVAYTQAQDFAKYINEKLYKASWELGGLLTTDDKRFKELGTKATSPTTVVSDGRKAIKLINTAYDGDLLRWRKKRSEMPPGLRTRLDDLLRMINELDVATEKGTAAADVVALSKEAIGCYSDALKLKPKAFGAYLNRLIDAHVQVNKHAEALNLFDQLSGQLTMSHGLTVAPQAYIAVASRLIQEKRYDEAAVLYERAAALAPDDARFKRGVTRSKTATLSDEADALELQMVDVSWSKFNADMRKKVVPLLELRRKIVSEDPTNAKNLYRLGRLARRCGPPISIDPTYRPVNHLRAAYTLEPNNLTYLYGLLLAMCEFHEPGRGHVFWDNYKKEGEQLYKLFLKLGGDPNNPPLG